MIDLQEAGLEKAALEAHTAFALQKLLKHSKKKVLNL